MRSILAIVLLVAFLIPVIIAVLTVLYELIVLDRFSAPQGNTEENKSGGGDLHTQQTSIGRTAQA